VATADLVVMETLLTELPPPAGEGHLVDQLIDRLPYDGRLLLIDLDRVPRHKKNKDKLACAKHLCLRLTSSHTFPASDTLPVIKDNLFDSKESPRKKLYVEIALYSRPNYPLISFNSSSEFEPNKDQQQALAKLKKFFAGKDRVFVLTGPAGTGKTSLFPEILRLSQQCNHKVELLAPTGRAAKRVSAVSSLGASTIHSTIYKFETTQLSADFQQEKEKGIRDAPFTLASKDEENDEDIPISLYELRDPLKEPTLFLIDESSLIGNRQVDQDEPEVIFEQGKLLSDLLKYALNHVDSRVVFIGDPEQLPPLGEKFSPALSEAELKGLIDSVPCAAALTQVMRQDEHSGLLDLADRAKKATINNGLDAGPNDPETGINILRQGTLPTWLIEAIARSESVIVAARNADVARWNRRIREGLNRPADQIVTGDLASVLRQNAEFGLRNGDDLIVEAVTHNAIEIKVRKDSLGLGEATFRFETMHGGSISFTSFFVVDLLYNSSAKEQKRVSKLLYIDFRIRNRALKPNMEEFKKAYASDSQVNALRIGYSYARTCHRAQGGEWPHVVVDFGGSRWLGPVFGRWAYTAVTRAKQSVWLYNLPQTGASGVDFLVNGAKTALEETQLRILEHRPIQSGVQLEIAGTEGKLLLNLYEKKGRPSKVSITGGNRPGFADLAIEEIESWIKQTRLDSFEPLPEKLEQVAYEIIANMSLLGYDFVMEPYSDYQVEFTVESSDESYAKALCSFKGDGSITSIRKMSGDLQLQEKLRKEVESILQ